jgi:hypothetical protein
VLSPYSASGTSNHHRPFAAAAVRGQQGVAPEAANHCCDLAPLAPRLRFVRGHNRLRGQVAKSSSRGSSGCRRADRAGTGGRKPRRGAQRHGPIGLFGQ